MLFSYSRQNVLALVAGSYFYILYNPFHPPDITLKLTQVLEQLKCPPKRGQNKGLDQLQQYIFRHLDSWHDLFFFEESEMLEKDQDAKVFRVSVTYGSDGPYITCHTVQAGGHNGSILHSVSTEQLLSHFIYLKHSGDCLKLC